MFPLIYGLAVLAWGLLIFAAGIGVGRQWANERARTHSGGGPGGERGA